MRHDLGEDRAEVGGEGEIAAFVKLFLLQARPFAVDAAAFDVAADDEKRAGMSVVGATIPVLAGHAAELGHRHYHDVVHPIAEIGDEGGDGAGEIVETLGELASRGALVDVGVPTSDVCEGDLEADVGLDQLRDL